uniref:CXXC-type domain-containing protein n=1 Tax=Caenorhabditis tropicalis TaxID=1561998 RepID=A0A1I7UTQ5_9PELO
MKSPRVPKQAETNEDPKVSSQHVPPLAFNKEDMDTDIVEEVVETSETKEALPKRILKKTQPHQQGDAKSVIEKLEELGKEVEQVKSDVKASRALQSATLTEVETTQIRLDEETDKRKEVVKLLKLRIKVLEEAISKTATSNKDAAPTGGQAPGSAEGLKDGATKAACVLCESTTHALVECKIFPNGSSRAAEFNRRNLCRRCAMAGCNLQTCPKPYIVCGLCAEAGIREDRSVRHLEGVCEEHKRMKAAKRAQNPPERRPKRAAPQQQQGEKKRAQVQQAQPEGPEVTPYLPIQAPQSRQQVLYYLPNNQMQYPQGIPVQLNQQGVPQQHQQAPIQLQQQGPYQVYGYQ